MQATIRPGRIFGTLAAPASKSMMQRACAAALLHKGKTTIYNQGTSDDDHAALEIIKNLGATIIHQADRIEIISNGIEPVSLLINCGESGLAARLFTPIASLSNVPVIIEGKDSLLNRPMDQFGKILPQLEVTLSDFNDHVPFTVCGPLQPKSIKIDGSISSQFLSGLLFAYSYAAMEAVTIDVSGLKSRPYIDMTLQVLELFGKPIAHDNYHRFHIDPALFNVKEDVEINIEADWSSASYWLVAGAIRGSVTVTGLNIDSVQADMAILKVLEVVNADLMIGPGFVRVKSASLLPFEFDATDCPDLFPALAALASACHGESYIKGVHRLFHKESNRAESIAEMLMQFGIPFSMEDDTLCVTGVDNPDYTTIDSYHDHRIAMAAAVTAIRAKGPVLIEGAEVVNKSYPDFFKDLKFLGIESDLKP